MIKLTHDSSSLEVEKKGSTLVHYCVVLSFMKMIGAIPGQKYVNNYLEKELQVA